MVMDLGHYGFDCKMRFFEDSDLAINVRWYEASPDALWFPTWHRFGNGDLASVKANWPGIGQVLGTRRYVKRPASPPNVTGKFFVGSIEQYQFGTQYPGVRLNCQYDGQCPSCGPVVPFPAPCELLAPFQNQNLILTIVQVLNPNFPPVGRVGQQFLFTLASPGVWNNAAVDPPAWAPNGGAFSVACGIGPDANLFYLGYNGFPVPPVSYIPWMVFEPAIPGVLNLQATWNEPAFAIANYTGTETWVMSLTTA